VLLSTPGTFHILVSENGAVANAPQMYRVVVNDVRTPTFTASDGTFSFVSLNWSSVGSPGGYKIFRGTTNNRAAATEIATLGAATVSYNDNTVVGSTVYFYWVEALQGVANYRPLAGPEQGNGNAPPVPANDDCASATILPGNNSSTNGTTVGATTDGSSTCGGTDDVYYAFTPACTSPVQLDVTGALSGAVVSVHLDCPANTGTEIACGAGTTTFDGQAGITVFIRVAGSAEGAFTLNVTQTGIVCDSLDFNNDEVFPDLQDLVDLYSVYGAGPCSTGTCNDIDFNNDGILPDSQDLVDYISVYGAGGCSTEGLCL
jgi:hypothetical protein